MKIGDTKTISWNGQDVRATITNLRQTDYGLVADVYAVPPIVRAVHESRWNLGVRMRDDEKRLRDMARSKDERAAKARRELIYIPDPPKPSNEPYIRT